MPERVAPSSFAGKPCLAAWLHTRTGSDVRSWRFSDIAHVSNPVAIGGKAEVPPASFQDRC